MNKLSRRDFLRGAATGAAGLAVMGLSGAIASEAAPGWDAEYDIVIIGSGAGLAAAVQARQSDPDASIVVLEKENNIGGMWKTASGHVLVGCTRLQAENGIEDDEEIWFKEEMENMGFRASPEIIRTFIKRGPEIIDWVEELGGGWSNVNDHGFNVYSIPRSHWTGVGPANEETFRQDTGMGFGLSWVVMWEKYLAANNVPILLEHEIEEIIREADGVVSGVVVTTPEGVKRFKAKRAVILSSGGCVQNDRMAQAFERRIVGPDCYGDCGTPCTGDLFVNNDGKGMLAAVKVGGLLTNMDRFSYYNMFFGCRSYFGWKNGAENASADTFLSAKGIARTAGFYNHCILVNRDAVRYVNESYGSDESYGHVDEQPDWPFSAAWMNMENIEKPRNIWAIGDAEIAKDLMWATAKLENPDPLYTSPLFDPDCVAVADTIEELAEKMGMDPAVLQETIDRYNSFVDSGTDEDFGKEDLSFKIATPPFYGLKACMVRHTQRNGLRVNTKSQVVDSADLMDAYVPVCGASWHNSIDEEAVIPHLYAIGEASCLVPYRINHGTLGYYATFARIAAENAVLESPID